MKKHQVIFIACSVVILLLLSAVVSGTYLYYRNGETKAQQYYSELKAKSTKKTKVIKSPAGVNTPTGSAAPEQPIAPTQTAPQIKAKQGAQPPVLPPIYMPPPPDIKPYQPPVTKNCYEVPVGASSYKRTVCDGQPVVDQVCLDAGTGHSLPPGYVCR